MKVFYREEQSVKKNNSFSPSASKPALVVDGWKKRYNAEVVTFAPATRAQMYKVHAQAYVDAVLELRETNGFGNKLPEVAAALLFVAGSMVAATLHAFKTGETSFSPTSGAHHACYAHGGGFCTFNFLVLAAVEVHEAGAGVVGIIDCDMHGGNGTVEIVERLDLGFIQHYSFGYDWARTEVTTSDWLKVFTLKVQDIMRVCDVVIYNAGADPHIDDPLGGALTTEEMATRDAIVFRAAQQSMTPVAISLAGGYQSPVDKVIALHNNTYRLAGEWEVPV